MNIFTLLDSTPTHLSNQVTRYLTQYGKTETFSAGQVILKEGTISDCIYIILDGSASVIKADTFGNSNIIAVAKKGAVFGEMGVFLDLTRSATITATSDLKALRLGNDSFVYALKHFPELTLRLLKSLAAKVNDVNKQLMSLIQSRVLIALCVFINAECEQLTSCDVKFDIRELMRKTHLDHMQLINGLLRLKQQSVIQQFSLIHLDSVSFHVDRQALSQELQRLVSDSLLPEAPEGNEK